MNYRKYSFQDEAEYQKTLEAIKIAPIEEEEQPQIGFDAVPITCVQTPATFDEEGNILTQAVLDPNYNVDILWHVEEPKVFEQYQVWPSGIGQHIIGGWESAYEADRLAR